MEISQNKINPPRSIKPKSSQCHIIIHNCLQTVMYPKTRVWLGQASAIGPLTCNNHRPVPLCNTFPTQVTYQTTVAVSQWRRNKLVQTILINSNLKASKHEFRDVYVKKWAEKPLPLPYRAQQGVHVSTVFQRTVTRKDPIIHNKICIDYTDKGPETRRRPKRHN